MEFKELLMSRYATKKFDGKIIDENKLEQLFEMIRFAPSALNIQPWKIKVVTDVETKKKLSAASMEQAQIITCSHLLVFCANTDLDGNAQKTLNLMKKAGVPEENLEQFQMIMNIFLSNFDSETGVNEAQCNVFIAAITAIYAAKSLGIDSCPMQGFNNEEYSKILEIPSSLVPTILVPIGYPADKQMPKLRFTKEEIFF
ncbi:nitroreductase family protein [Methanobacterium spitsbergense]|uniref:Nitroreductase family protein n=1 Tax=Methanobacterium spitsbergense TaxID=2874285 RepID=A0A8T5UVF2_9EURY|nr:nitroreductase family protein [Methanobacterium spitsbergense]MBZ2166217.1 nitroreductase family protein [Methanobacterium spitsbergense]